MGGLINDAKTGQFKLSLPLKLELVGAKGSLKLTPGELETIGRRVRDERKRRDWTQRELAAELTKRGVKSGTSNVSMIETGDVQMSLAMAVEVANVFGCSLDWLAGREEDSTNRWEVVDVSLNALEAQSLADGAEVQQ